MLRVFIDGQAGTTGLQITERLSARDDLSVVYLNDAERKDPARRQAMLMEADISILCLPDQAAIEAVELAQGHGRIIDASTAHRVDPDWVYGVPELDGIRQRLRDATRVSNPGCYPQGFILMTQPLIAAGILSADVPLRCNAVSGYSGGGRQMIEGHQAHTAAEAERLDHQAYALHLRHKHVPEMQMYSGTTRSPLFAPSVGHYYQGMLVNVPLFVAELNDATPDDVYNCLVDRYQDEQFIKVLPNDLSVTEEGYLNPTATNGSNNIEIMMFSNEDHIVLTARYDNLGKGAAGAAVQNLNIMLGVDEAYSL